MKTFPIFGVAALAGLLVFCDSALRAEKPTPVTRRPYRVLILGDSISIGYTPLVKEMLAGEAVVHRPMAADGQKPENCAGTVNGVKHLDRWLKIDGGDWDVIHFNFGLHDMKRVKAATGENSNDSADPRQSEPEAYEKQLREIVTKLKATKARLVFAATTPVPPGGVKPHRDVEDPARYNAIAKRVMDENGIAFNDLFAFITPHLADVQLPVNVHYKPEGSKLLAGQVVRAVREAAGIAAP